jgi:hypothetical protein
MTHPIINGSKACIVKSKKKKKKKKKKRVEQVGFK